MKRKINSFVANIILLFLFIHTPTFALDFKNNYHYKYTSDKDKIIISPNNLQRLKQFFLGKFYSYEQNNLQKNSFGIYFALSESGHSSVMSFCDDQIQYCILDNLKFITKAKCQRISKEPCFIIAIEDEIILNKKSYLINDKSLPGILNSHFEISSKTNQNYMSDISAILYRDREGSDYD